MESSGRCQLYAHNQFVGFFDYILKWNLFQSLFTNPVFIPQGCTLYILYVYEILLTASSKTLVNSRLTAMLWMTFGLYTISLVSRSNVPRMLGFWISLSMPLSFYKEAIFLMREPLSTPLAARSHLSSDDNPLFHNPNLYRTLVGVLQYLTFTRPVI